MPSLLLRAAQFPDFYTEKRLLVCLYCCHSVDYEKLSTIKNHIKSAKHQSRKKAKLHKPQKPVTIAKSISSSKQRSEFIKDYVAMFLKANIPLEKSNNMVEFMKKYCVGGTISDSKNLRRFHVPQVAEDLRAKIAMKIAEAVEKRRFLQLTSMRLQTTEKDMF